MDTELHLVSQFTARTFVAFAVSCLLYSLKWWTAVISFPLIMALGCYALRVRWPTHARYLVETRSLDVLKSLFFRMIILYVFGSAFIFQWHLDSWYGWLVGGVAGGVFSVVMAKAQRYWLGFRS